MKFVVAVLVALAAAGPAAARSDQWWTTDHAEAVLLDSDWAFDRDVEDAVCSGWGSYKVASDGTKTFRRFVCTAYAEVEQTWCLPGECSDGSASSSCKFTVKLQPVGADRFLLAGTRSGCR